MMADIRNPEMRPPETGAVVLLMALLFLFPILFFLFFDPVIRLFDARAFSFAISTAFAVFGTHRRPVNRLYFFRRAFHERAAGRRFRQPLAHNVLAGLPRS